MSSTVPTGRPKVTIDGAAEYLSVNPLTIRRWIADGRIPAYRFGPKLIRIDLDDLDAMARPIPNAKTGDVSRPTSFSYDTRAR